MRRRVRFSLGSRRSSSEGRGRTWVVRIESAASRLAGHASTRGGGVPVGGADGGAHDGHERRGGGLVCAHDGKVNSFALSFSVRSMQVSTFCGLRKHWIGSGPGLRSSFRMLMRSSKDASVMRCTKTDGTGCWFVSSLGGVRGGSAHWGGGLARLYARLPAKQPYANPG